MADQPSDSPLSLAANWISIITFITTSLGSLGILWSFYKQLERAEEDLNAYGIILAESSKALIDDFDIINRIGQRSSAEPLSQTLQMYNQLRVQIRTLNDELHSQKPYEHGWCKVIRIWKLRRNTELAKAVREIERLRTSLSAMKINLLFWYAFCS